jgi:hypothetical protein
MPENRRKIEFRFRFLTRSVPVLVDRPSGIPENFQNPVQYVLTFIPFEIILPWCRQLSTNCRHHETVFIEIDLLHKIVLIRTLMG